MKQSEINLPLAPRDYDLLQKRIFNNRKSFWLFSAGILFFGLLTLLIGAIYQDFMGGLVLSLGFFITGIIMLSIILLMEYPKYRAAISQGRKRVIRGKIQDKTQNSNGYEDFFYLKINQETHRVEESYYYSMQIDQTVELHTTFNGIVLEILPLAETSFPKSGGEIDPNFDTTVLTKAEITQIRNIQYALNRRILKYFALLMLLMAVSILGNLLWLDEINLGSLIGILSIFWVGGGLSFAVLYREINKSFLYDLEGGVKFIVQGEIIEKTQRFGTTFQWENYLRVEHFYHPILVNLQDFKSFTQRETIEIHFIPNSRIALRAHKK